MDQNHNNDSRYVKWQVFVWAVGILTIAFGWSISAQAKLEVRVDMYNDHISTIETQLSQIQTDLGWIKRTLVTEKTR